MIFMSPLQAEIFYSSELWQSKQESSTEPGGPFEFAGSCCREICEGRTFTTPTPLVFLVYPQRHHSLSEKVNTCSWMRPVGCQRVITSSSRGLRVTQDAKLGSCSRHVRAEWRSTSSGLSTDAVRKVICPRSSRADMSAASTPALQRASLPQGSASKQD